MSWLEARPQIQEGKDYTDSVEIPVMDGTITVHHRLLTETELVEIEGTVDREEMVDHVQSDLSDAEQRLQALQQKDELTDEEKQELKDLAQQLQAEQVGMMDSMGEDTFKAFMRAGKEALVATEEDITEHFETLTPDEQEQRFNFVPNTREEMRDAIETDMRIMVEDQPFPIKFIVGQKAYGESLSVISDTELDAGNPMSDA